MAGRPFIHVGNRRINMDHVAVIEEEAERVTFYLDGTNSYGDGSVVFTGQEAEDVKALLERVIKKIETK